MPVYFIGDWNPVESKTVRTFGKMTLRDEAHSDFIFDSALYNCSTDYTVPFTYVLESDCTVNSTID